MVRLLWKISQGCGLSRSHFSFLHLVSLLQITSFPPSLRATVLEKEISQGAISPDYLCFFILFFSPPPLWRSPSFILPLYPLVCPPLLSYFYLPQQATTRSPVHPSASMASSTALMAGHHPPVATRPMQMGSWRKGVPPILKMNEKKASPGGPRQIEETIGLLRGLQICPSSVEFTSVRNINTRVKRKCK